MIKDLQQYLNKFFSASELNRLHKNYGGGRIFDDPLIGVASGDDYIFPKYKELITPEYLTPLELWVGCDQNEIPASNLRVVSIVFPYIDKIRKESKNVVELKRITLPAEISEVFTIFSKGDFYSNWSERHTAFAAGLGTFSLHEALITEVGCNVRLASVVTNAPLDITKRKYGDEPYANCLFYSKGICKKCVERCPAGAISEKGHNKIKCYNHQKRIERRQNLRLAAILKPHFRRIDGKWKEEPPPVGCAFCQFNVPCMDKNPMANEQK